MEGLSDGASSEPVHVAATTAAREGDSASGSQVTVKKAGMVTITASQPGDVHYHAAPSVAKSLTIGKRPLTVTAWP